jgi:hypothetical protein
MKIWSSVICVEPPAMCIEQPPIER